MAAADLNELLLQDVAKWPRPRDTEIEENLRANYVARCKAVVDVAGGTSIRKAAQQHGIDRRTVGKDCAGALTQGPDGRIMGFRACRPFYFRQSRRKSNIGAPPRHKKPYAFTQLLASSKELMEIVASYTFALPTGRRKNRRFDKHVSEFLAAVCRIHGPDCYPLFLDDKGRRALLKYHKTRRFDANTLKAAELDDQRPEINRFNQLFLLQPLDRLEFDGHTVDVDWEFQVPHPSGHTVSRKIASVTLLAVIDSVSRYLIAYVLIFGAYNHLDILQLFSKTLRPWVPRNVIVPGLAYQPGATLGLPFDAAGGAPRGILIAGDNAKAHHAFRCVEQLLNYHQGILNFGPPHVPEARPLIEAFFRRIEASAFRQFPGGFEPETEKGAKTSTPMLRIEDHPANWEALLDLMDVICSAHNVTPHSGLGNALPSNVLHEHLQTSCAWHVPRSVDDANKLSTIRERVHIRGNQKEGRQPYVQYEKAIYRTQFLMGRWDLVGKGFDLEVNMFDLRQTALLDPDSSTLLATLRALAPWTGVRHDLHLRHQINRARHRGLIRIAGSENAVEAFSAFMRSQSWVGAAAPDLHARLSAQGVRSALKAPPSIVPFASPSVPDRIVSFANEED